MAKVGLGTGKLVLEAESLGVPRVGTDLGVEVQTEQP